MRWIFPVIAAGAIGAASIVLSSSAETGKSVRSRPPDPAVSVANSGDQGRNPPAPRLRWQGEAVGQPAVTTAKAAKRPKMESLVAPGGSNAAPAAHGSEKATARPATAEPWQARTSLESTEPHVETAASWEPMIVAQSNAAPHPRPAALRRSLAPVQPKTWLVVTGSRVNLRDAPNLAAARVASYAEGSRLEQLERKGEWVRVRRTDSSGSGWMHKDYLAKVPMADAGTPGATTGRWPDKPSDGSGPEQSAAASFVPDTMPREERSPGRSLIETNDQARRLHALLIETQSRAIKAQSISEKYLSRYDKQSAGDQWIKKKVVGFGIPIRVSQSQARALILKEMGDDRVLMTMQADLFKSYDAISKSYIKMRNHIKADMRRKIDELHEQSRLANRDFTSARDELIAFGDRIEKEYGCCQFPPDNLLRTLHGLAATMRAKRLVSIETGGAFPMTLRKALESPVAREVSLHR